MDLLYVREFLSDNNHNRNAHREKQWYFFTLRERKYPNGTRPSRSVAHGLDGYWKATGVDKAIISDGQVIGFRKALDFYDGNQSSGIKTKWKMHEYRINQKSLPPDNSNGSDPTKVWSRGLLLLVKLFQFLIKEAMFYFIQHAISNLESRFFCSWMIGYCASCT